LGPSILLFTLVATAQEGWESVLALQGSLGGGTSFAHFVDLDLRATQVVVSGDFHGGIQQTAVSL
jgi:hypothetical protein